MKRQVATVLGLVLSTSLFAGAAYSQNHSPAPSVSPTPESLYKKIEGYGIENPELRAYILITLFSGTLGGLIYHLINYRKIQELLWEEAKKSSKTQEDSSIKIKPSSRILCCMSHMAIGAAAAPPAILLLRPESAFALLAMSLVSGSAGSAVFRNVQEKMLVNLLASEIEEKKEVKAKHEKMRKDSLELNEEQSAAVGQLLQIIQEHDSKSGDWDRVEQIAEKLKVLCRECSQTLKASKPFIDDSKDSSTSKIKNSHFASPNSTPVANIDHNGNSQKLPQTQT
jgi:hypothetical protein